MQLYATDLRADRAGHVPHHERRRHVIHGKSSAFAVVRSGSTTGRQSDRPLRKPRMRGRIVIIKLDAEAADDERRCVVGIVRARPRP
jgi:hypothetical protein